MHLYHYSEKKAAEIGNIETILKQAAFDKHITKHFNILSKDKTRKKYLNPALRVGSGSSKRHKYIHDEKLLILDLLYLSTIDCIRSDIPANFP